MELFVGFDLTRIMVEGSREGLYDAATAFCEALVQTSSEEEKLGTDLSHLWNDTITPQRAKILLKSAQKVHDHKLDKQGQFGQLRRCNKYPFDPKLRKKKKYQKDYYYTKIVDRATQWYYERAEVGNETAKKELKISTGLQVDTPCRGGQLRVHISFD